MKKARKQLPIKVLYRMYIKKAMISLLNMSHMNIQLKKILQYLRFQVYNITVLPLQKLIPQLCLVLLRINPLAEILISHLTGKIHMMNFIISKKKLTNLSVRARHLNVVIKNF